MNRTQQGTAVAVCLLGLAVLAAGAVFLVRQWQQEVAARERLEEENEQLRAENELLKERSQLEAMKARDASLRVIRAGKLAETALEQQQSQGASQPRPKN